MYTARRDSAEWVHGADGQDAYSHRRSKLNEKQLYPEH